MGTNRRKDRAERRFSDQKQPSRHARSEAKPAHSDVCDDPSIAPRTEQRPIDRARNLAQSDVPETSRTATFDDFNRTSSRVKHRPARYETKIGTPISSRFRGKHRAQRRLQLCCLEKRKRAERNRGSQKHQKDSVKLFKVAFRVGESTRFLE